MQRADRILVLEEGEIVEEGNHEKLVTLGGRYAQMLAKQSGFYEKSKRVEEEEMEERTEEDIESKIDIIYPKNK